jgi:hypothetical protein
VISIPGSSNSNFSLLLHQGDVRIPGAPCCPPSFFIVCNTGKHYSITSIEILGGLLFPCLDPD